MSFYGLSFGAWGVSHQALWAGAPTATVGGAVLIAGETDGLGIDFTYSTDRSLQMSVLDTTTLTNAGNFDPYSKLTYTSPAIKLCCQSDGVYRYGSHNLYLNSASPANQAVTVVSGGTYSVVITGTVSITVSGAATGTYTSGTNNFTAATTTLTCGSTSGTGTVAVFRTPCVGTYLATTGAIVIDLPYEWSAAGAAQGIRIEDTRTNLCLRSDDLTNASWTKSNMTTAYTSTGPGALANSATRCTATAGNATALQAITSASATRITSMFVKRITGTGNIDITQDNGTNWTTITATASWTKVELAAALATDPTVGIRIVTNADAVDVALFQHEVGDSATSPIQTLAVALPRAADHIALAGSKFPLAPAAPGSAVVQFKLIERGTFILVFDDGTSNEAIWFRDNVGSIMDCVVFDGGSQQVGLTFGTPSLNASHKAGTAWATSDWNVCFDGGSVTQDVTCTIPSPTQMCLGYSASVGFPIRNGYLQQITYLPRRVTNGQLQTMTGNATAGQAIGLLLTLTNAS